MILRLIEQQVGRIGLGTLFIFSLALLALTGVAWTLADLIRGLSLSFLNFLIVVALLLSWNLARARPVPNWLGLLLLLTLAGWLG